MCKLNKEIRKLSPKNVFELSQILEVGKGWKDVMAIITNEQGTLKYTVEHMRMIEDASDKQKRLCSEIFLEEWGTSGQEMPDLLYLLKLLKEVQLFRAADYVSVNLLKQDFPEGSRNSPAASVSPPIERPVPTAPPLSCSFNENNDTIHLNETLPFEAHINRLVCSDNIINYAYNQLVIGTNGFSPEMELGHGGFGNVYKCYIGNSDTPVAVKKLRTEGTAVRGKEEIQFRTEVLTLSNLTHPNLLSLLGYSCDGSYLCLLYPYMANGSLQDRIECKEESNPLEWNQRYDIALGTARGILHLHSYTNKPLVHRDIKSANILLDQNLTPKVGDFGLARYGASARSTISISVTTTVLGTSAYMAPEAFRGDVSVKMDVFSFGVASHVDEVDNIDELIDKKPSTSNITLVLALYDIAQNCLQEKRTRPDMLATLKAIENISHEN